MTMLLQGSHNMPATACINSLMHQELDLIITFKIQLPRVWCGQGKLRLLAGSAVDLTLIECNDPCTIALLKDTASICCIATARMRGGV